MDWFWFWIGFGGAAAVVGIIWAYNFFFGRV